MKEYKYYVIGGQYQWYCYGGSNTLHGAKCLASKNVELWDNWQGLRTPKIFRVQDTEVITGEFYGRVQEMRVPKCLPDELRFTYYKKNAKGKWEEIYF